MPADTRWLAAFPVLLSSSSVIGASYSSGATASSIRLATNSTSSSDSAPASSTGVPSDATGVTSWCKFAPGEIYKGYTTHCGLDYYSGDISNWRVYDVEQCTGLCDITPDCVAASYRKVEDGDFHGRCWLKHAPASEGRPDPLVLGMHRKELSNSSPVSSHYGHNCYVPLYFCEVLDACHILCEENHNSREVDSNDLRAFIQQVSSIFSKVYKSIQQFRTEHLYSSTKLHSRTKHHDNEAYAYCNSDAAWFAIYRRI
ncbi:hypothetical protein G6514_003702 [Epicoccum nigrum]|nr:hypothetical protein G6514_003702 [Epicoccum nigrum]